MVYDTDGNGVSDGDEDFDTDGLTNVEEQGWGTDPYDDDTDDDTLLDGWEVQYTLGGNLYPDLNDSDDDETSDDLEDYDNDGLTNAEEQALGTDPNKWDTDEDGLSDGWEVDNDLNPLLPDSDDDGINDGDEDFDYDYLSNIDEQYY